MKLFHTSDLHLQDTDDERWAALQDVLQLAGEEQADCLTISGDLFDQNYNGETLRPAIRQRFNEVNFPVVIVSGNHDAEVYQETYDYGEDVYVISDRREPFEFDDFRIWGLPYQQRDPEDVLEVIHSCETDDRAVDVLLFHGDLLDRSFSSPDTGDENAYMPCRSEFFKATEFNYVLAGHYHSQFFHHPVQRDDDETTHIVYPGSPVSITRRETGTRHVATIEPGEDPEPLGLETFHYRTVALELDPLTDQAPQDRLREELSRREDSESVEFLVEVSGFFNGDVLGEGEQSLQDGLKRVLEDEGQYEEGDFTFRAQDVRHVLNDELYRDFRERLDDYEDEDIDDDLREYIDDLVLKAMSQAKSS